MKGGNCMRYEFTENDIKNEINKLYLEEDDVSLEGKFIEGDGKHFTLTGSAVIDGEKYNDFETDFELAEGRNYNTAKDIMNADWLWYDYKC
jgi:hypothetical protein